MATPFRAIRAQVGERLRQLRNAARLTQENLAERAGLSYKFIGEIERGQANPTIDTLSVLAKALAVEVHELLVSVARDNASDSAYRIGLHDIEVVRDALRTADHLLDRYKRGRDPRRLLKAATRRR